MAADQLRPVSRPLIGHPAHVANVMRAAAQRGHLIDYGTPHRISRGRVSIDVTLLMPAPPAERPVQRRTVSAGTWVRVGLGTAAVVIVGLFVYVVSLIVAWVTAHLPVVLGTLALVTAAALYWLLKAGSGGCPGAHCPGGH